MQTAAGAAAVASAVAGLGPSRSRCASAAFAAFASATPRRPPVPRRSGSSSGCSCHLPARRRSRPDCNPPSVAVLRRTGYSRHHLSTHDGSNNNGGNNGGGSNNSDDIGIDDSDDDYFAIFGLPRRFGLSPSVLKGRYLGLMTRHHPDKRNHGHYQRGHDDGDGHDGHDDAVVPVAANAITHAYQTLKAPHTRAAHLLSLRGRPLLEEDRGGGGVGGGATNAGDNDSDDSTGLVGMDFLMDMMDWRERVEDLNALTVASDRQRREKKDALSALWKETKDRHAQCQADLEQVWDGDGDIRDGDGYIDGPDLRQARKLAAQLQYWHRLETTLREAMDVWEDRGE